RTTDEQRVHGSRRVAVRRRAARESIFSRAAHRRDAAPGSMSDILFLILRRLRAPLITVIVVYAISVGGLALIPGVTPEGERVPMSIFHAFYFMSFTATTIGFGEIPYPFTDAQRLWVTFAIYLS